MNVLQAAARCRRRCWHRSRRLRRVITVTSAASGVGKTVNSHRRRHTANTDLPLATATAHRQSAKMRMTTRSPWSRAPPPAPLPSESIGAAEVKERESACQEEGECGTD